MFIKGFLIVLFFLCEQSLQVPLSPQTFDVKSVNKDPALLPQPLVITKPEEKEDILAFLNIWENRFASQSDVTYSVKNEGAEGAPKTILAVTSLKMANLIPQDVPHPLYSTTYEKLTDDFILDSLSTQTIDFNDPLLTSPEGVTIKTMGGKDLVFKKEFLGNKFTVNGVEIEKHSTITGDKNVIILSDFLFDYYNEVKTASDELFKSFRPQEPITGLNNDGSDTSRNNPDFRAEGLDVVPQIPESLKDPHAGAIPSGFVSIWENRLSNIGEPVNTDLRNQETAPKTILTVTSIKMINLIPQDAPHPLYSTSYEKLTDDFILDSLSTQTIDFNDPQLTSPQGVKIKTMSGKDLLFRKDQRRNVITVNNIDVEDHHEFPDGTVVIIINNFLFNNYDEVQKAFHELSQRPGASFSPFGGPVPVPKSGVEFENPSSGSFGVNERPVPNSGVEFENPSSGSIGVHERPVPNSGVEFANTPSDPETSLPDIPESFSTSNEGDKLLDIWKFRLSKVQEHSSFNIDSRIPETILPVTLIKMINLIPRDAPHPLYNTEYQKLADDFILDSLSSDKIDFEDPNLTSPEGVTIKTMTGKDLLFKKDVNTDKITVNGIDIENHKPLSDQKTVVILSDFLFNYYEVIQKAFEEMQRKPDTDHTDSQRSLQGEPERKYESETQTELESATGTSNIPQIPLDIEEGSRGAEEASNLVFIWSRRLANVQTAPGSSRTATNPKTVLAVESFKMINLIPQDAPHPLFSPKYGELTDSFILDSLSTDEINFEDPRLSSPEGITIKTISGKDLKFTKDPNSNNIQVNGIDVANHKILNGNTNLIVIKDYLFNHYDEVQNAFQELLKTNTNVGFDFHGHPPIPAVPVVLESPDVGIDFSGFLRVWENRLSNFGSTSTGDAATESVPKTIVAVSSVKMSNLTPQDAPNPLYSDEYEHLTNEFILDSLSSETIDVNDPNLLKDGVTVATLSGNHLTFKKEEGTDNLTVNGINVENSKTFEDGTTVFIISDFLFNHFNGVRSAFEELQRKSPQSGQTPF